MWRRIGIAVSALVLVYALWYFFFSETAQPRAELVPLPCELKWSVAEINVTEITDIRTRAKTFVPIVGHLKGPQDWLWSHLCNVSAVGRYPDGINVPQALPEDEHEKLLSNLRNGVNPDRDGRTHVVRMFAVCIPDGPLPPSNQAQLPIVGVTVAVGFEGDSVYFAGLMEMPAEPGKFWIQLCCEFTTEETFSSFIRFTGGPVSEVAVTVTP